MNRYLTKTTGLILLLLFPIAALAADVTTTTAPTSWPAEFFKMTLSGLFSGGITALIAWLTLRQRQNEFEIQTKMQIESLHSDEKKKACNDFLSRVNPHVFAYNEFDFSKMNFFITPLHIYSTENHFSYFENVTRFIIKHDMVNYGKEFTEICSAIESLTNLRESIKSALDDDLSEKTDLQQELKSIHPRISELKQAKGSYENFLSKKYSPHYELAVEAAKKLIWNEPIEKAQPLQLEDLPDEDDI